MFLKRKCLCGTDITESGVHYCSLLKCEFDAGPPELDVSGMAEAASKEREKALIRADEERRNRWFNSYILTKLIGNPVDGMLLGGDPMGAALAAAEIRGENLEKVIKDNLGSIKDTMKNAGMSEDEINNAINSALNRKETSWF